MPPNWSVFGANRVSIGAMARRRHLPGPSIRHCMASRKGASSFDPVG
ncbi:MAG: hypothetical protein OXU61_08095 [Gammaproteobacteria bacterium]|nr:hypothetical protein [Gammaproteobacteria bacterium]